MDRVLEALNEHHKAFFSSRVFAEETGQPAPLESRAWSQIIVSLLTGIRGLDRKKGPDFIDGSDVKAANVWGAIDTPRFNGCIKAGTMSSVSNSMKSLDEMPYLFFVLWDYEPSSETERVRIWCVRPQYDNHFRNICQKWYSLRASGEIVSDNFQLHPPRNLNSDIFTNNCGNLHYPLLFCAMWDGDEYYVDYYEPDILQNGECQPA